MAVMPVEVNELPTDPLRRNLASLAVASETVAKTCRVFPGLQKRYARLCEAVLAARPKRPLHGLERQVEERILALLKQGAGLPDDSLPTIFPHCAPASYLPALPAPLWPELIRREETAPRDSDDQPVPGSKVEGVETGRQIANREKQDPRLADRSPFILNRFEKSWPWPKW